MSKVSQPPQSCIIIYYTVKDTTGYLFFGTMTGCDCLNKDQPMSAGARPQGRKCSVDEYERLISDCAALGPTGSALDAKHAERGIPDDI